MRDFFADVESNRPFIEMQKLQDKYRCTECSSNGVCYRQKHPETGKMVHINMEPHLLTVWATLIIEGTAVPQGLPTHVTEFEKLVREAFYPSKKKKPRQHSGSSGTFQGDVHVHNHINNVPVPVTPCESKKSRKPTSIFSPIHGFTVKDYKRRGLMAFMEWCEESFEDEDGEFRQAYAQPEWANDRSQAAGEAEAKRENRCIDRFARLLSRF